MSAILHSSGDPRADRLLRQFTAPRRVLRRVDGPVLVVTLDVVTSDLRVDLDEDLRSGLVRVVPTTSTRPTSRGSATGGRSG